MMSDCVAMNCQCYLWLKMRKSAAELCSCFQGWVSFWGFPSLPLLLSYPNIAWSLFGVGITVSRHKSHKHHEDACGPIIGNFAWTWKCAG